MNQGLLNAAQQAKSSGSLTELKKRILFLIAAIFVFRVGSHIPVPAIDPARLMEIFKGGQQGEGLLNLLNTFSGGALSRLSIFSLGIMPYISASIIIQLLSSVWPPLEQLKKEGQSGKRKITQYTRYLTLVLASLQAFAMSKLMSGSDVQVGFNYYIVVTITLVTGTMFLMWLGEQITERGIGNGISMLIFAGIVANLPTAIVNTLEKVRQGEMHAIGLIMLLALIVLVISFVVFVERGQRRITVNYPQRQQGRRLYAGQTSHLPLKINMAGVIPPIFATSILVVPTQISSMMLNYSPDGIVGKIFQMLSVRSPVYLILFASAIVFFCFFYTALMYNPKDTADNLKKSGGFLPGIRPGEQTAAYIDKVMTRLTVVGAIYITAVALLPELLAAFMDVPFYFGGTSLLIIVVVTMDFMAQAQAHLMSHQYEGLMKKSRLKGK